MPLSWNEIKTRVFAFSKEWQDETSEDAEAKSFWDDFKAGSILQIESGSFRRKLTNPTSPLPIPTSRGLAG